MKDLFTIGYSIHTLDSFIATLKKYSIEAVADVRSVPFSQYKPEFNPHVFEEALKRQMIHYVFLGDQCGGRTNESKYYIDGKVNYKLLSEDAEFKSGLHRIINGLSKYRIALMCAEKDPIFCHRTILICRNLRYYNISIRHILGDGNLEEHKESELRLLKLLKLNQMSIFTTASDQMERAYDKQGEKIAYKDLTSADTSLTLDG
ncbi:MAG: DUF488 domain-containing protein [Deltaproteobacteria bacterium]|nr:DUF488 domain-containing protein [Deltaproteobacteria bacterium]